VADLAVPSAPPLATVSNVELMHTGTWNISTGVVTFTRDDLANAVAALDCPAVRRPVLKLGHAEPDPVQGMRWDGEPAVGYIANMAVAENGRTLVGDYAGMPSWLGDVIASAYPDRSIEGQFDHVCQMGHTHPFVVTAVALLGVTAPGIGTLQSLQDVAALYGVAAARPSGDMVAVTVHASREDTVPNPRAPHVAAGVTTEDVRRAFYDSDFGRSWDIWIEAIELDPLQIIAIDDATGGRSRVPIEIGDGDGEAAVSFSDPVPVVIRYEDAPAVAASASAPQVIRYGSRAESRPEPAPMAAGQPPATELVAAEPAPPEPPNVPPVEPAAGPTPTPEGEAPMPALDEGLRERLGLGADADEATILSAVDDLVDKATAPPEPTPEPQPEPVAASPALPPGTVAIDEATLADLRQKAEQGVAARARQLTEDRDRAIDDAIKAGKTLPARRDHWQQAWAADPDGTRQMLASLAPGLVPLEEIGEPGGEPAEADDEAKYDHLFTRKAG
jgi:hypothetical protein